MDFLPGKKTKILAVLGFMATTFITGLVASGKMDAATGAFLISMIGGLVGPAAAVTIHQAVSRGK